MTHKQNLETLLVKVEAGKALACPADHFRDVFPVYYSEACFAFEGSLDAAHSLHKAVLPNYGWGVSNKSTVFLYPPDSRPFSVTATNPARAWLIAIIKDLIAEEE